MRSVRWVLLSLTAIACAGDTGIAPHPPATAVPTLQGESYEARLQTSRQSLTQGAAALQAYLGAVSAHGRFHDTADVQAALSRVRDQLGTLSGPRGLMLADGTPVYPSGTDMHWENAGTWMRLSTDGVFTASSQYSQPVLLHTVIRGNTSTGWTKSSDDGFTVTPGVPQMSDAARPLFVPSDMRDCNASNVTISGTAEHTAGYAFSITVLLIGIQYTYQVDSRQSRAPDVSCLHTPLTADVTTSGFLTVGATGFAGAIWHGSNSTTVSDCATTWSAAPDGIVTLAEGGGSPPADSRTVTAVAPGTATITATCRGLSSSAPITVTAPTCQDATASNYEGSLPCVYPQPQVCQDATASNFNGPLPCDFSSQGGTGGGPPPPTPPSPGGTWSCYMVQVEIASYFGEYYLGSYWVDDHIQCDYVPNGLLAPTVLANMAGGPSIALPAAATGRTVTIAAATNLPKGSVATIMQRSSEVAPDVIFVDPTRVNPSQLAAILRIADQRLSMPRTGRAQLFVLSDFGWKKGVEAQVGGQIRSAAEVLHELRSADKHPVHGLGDLQSLRVTIGGH